MTMELETVSNMELLCIQNAIIYLAMIMEQVDVCTCQRTATRNTKQSSWITGRVMTQKCGDGETLYKGLCYTNNTGYRMLSPGFEIRNDFDPCNPPTELKDNNIVQQACNATQGKQVDWTKFFAHS
jgi:hypothetical protein